MYRISDILVESMRNRGPHRENVENILAICLPILTMQHIRESSSANQCMRISAWNEWHPYKANSLLYKGINCRHCGCMFIPTAKGQSAYWFQIAQIRMKNKNTNDTLISVMPKLDTPCTLVKVLMR